MRTSTDTQLLFAVVTLIAEGLYLETLLTLEAENSPNFLRCMETRSTRNETTVTFVLKNVIINKK